MKLLSLTLLLSVLTLITCAQQSLVRLETSKGNITVVLYDETPKHRDMFLRTIKKGLFNDAAFNRVIKSFVSQAGELDDTILNREKQHPETPIQRIPAEIMPSLYHKKGALGMGRNENPEKSSYLTQIYLVEGKIQTDAQLNLIEEKKGTKLSAIQREVYKTIGGIPYLDNDYTIFGEIVNGLEIAEIINSVPTNKDDVPLTPITFKPVILSKKEAIKLLKEMSLEIPVHK